MQMEQFLHQLERSGPALYVLQTPWVWPVLEILHFIGMSLLFGAVAIADLRLMGRFRELPPAMLPVLMRWAFAGFVLNAASGLLFLVANPTQYFYNWLFWLKMGLVLAAGANVVAYRTLSGGILPGGPVTSASAPRFEGSRSGIAIGALSLTLWLGVMLAGRMLPFLGGD